MVCKTIELTVDLNANANFKTKPATKILLYISITIKILNHYKRWQCWQIQYPNRLGRIIKGLFIKKEQTSSSLIYTFVLCLWYNLYHNNSDQQNSVMLFTQHFLLSLNLDFQVYFLSKQAPPNEKEEALKFSQRLAHIGMSLPTYIDAYETEDDERYK